MCGCLLVIYSVCVLTQFDDVWHGGVPAALGAGRHRQVVDVSWRQRQAGPHQVTSHLTQTHQSQLSTLDSTFRGRSVHVRIVQDGNTV